MLHFKVNMPNPIDDNLTNPNITLSHITSSYKVVSRAFFEDTMTNLKAILRLFIYKALYNQSYLGSKTTMTTGEWSCLISFAWDQLTCSERRGGSEKFKMKIFVSSGIRTHASPRHD